MAFVAVAAMASRNRSDDGYSRPRHTGYSASSAAEMKAPEPTYTLLADAGEYTAEQRRGIWAKALLAFANKDKLVEEIYSWPVQRTHILRTVEDQETIFGWSAKANPKAKNFKLDDSASPEAHTFFESLPNLQYTIHVKLPRNNTAITLTFEIVTGCTTEGNRQYMFQMHAGIASNNGNMKKQESCTVSNVTYAELDTDPVSAMNKTNPPSNPNDTITEENLARAITYLRVGLVYSFFKNVYKLYREVAIFYVYYPGIFLGTRGENVNMRFPSNSFARIEPDRIYEAVNEYRPFLTVNDFVTWANEHPNPTFIAAYISAIDRCDAILRCDEESV